MLMTWIAVLFGVVIGLALGLLGGGGSILTVPVFVYVLGYDAKDAIPMSLAVVGITSIVGAATRWRDGAVNGRMGIMFGAVATLGTYGGARLARIVPGTVQLAIFGVVMLLAAVFMARGRREPMADPARGRGRFPLVALEGVFVGGLTGLVGVGGGFLIVPALVLLAVPMHQAVGTSLLVIAMNCAVGLASSMGPARIVWSSVALVAAGTLPGIAAGGALNRRASQTMLRRAFAALLVLLAAFILYRNLPAALTGVR
jgi:uncharacterized protein